MEDRRRADRQPALWMGRCHLQDEPSEQWRECAIIDVSTLGVGIDLFHHPDPIELLGLWQDGELRLDLSSSRRITLRLEIGSSVELTVEGEVRNAGSRPDGIVRAGVEFVDLSETERSLLALLERRAAERLQEPVSSVRRDDGLLDQLEEDHFGEHAGHPQNRVGSLRLPIGIPGYELLAKGVSYVTNQPFVVEATRSLDFVGRPLFNFLGSCQSWLGRPSQDAPVQEDHDEEVVRGGPTEERARVSEVVSIRAGHRGSDAL